MLEDLATNHDLLFIGIDALDECDLHERRWVLSLIGTITKKSKAEQSVRFFLTSRKEQDIERSLNSAIRFNIKAHHLERDIQSYISTQASKLGKKFEFTRERKLAVA